MVETIHHDVSGTAFVVNYSRSRMEKISQDYFAHLWVTRDSIALWKDLAQNVYPNDDLNVSLRNRFYLGHLCQFLHEQKFQRPVAVNIASGFTSYPYLIDEKCTFLEFDLPAIMEYKKKTVTRWMREKKLPERSVHYFPIDLNDAEQRGAMKEEFKRAIGSSPSFVILEGVTYYLQKDVLLDLISLLSEVQTRGSVIAFDYWKPDAMSYPVMIRLKGYFDRKFGDRGTGWYLYDESFFRDIGGYTMKESADIARLEVKYSPTRLFQGQDNKIPVYFSVLERVQAAKSDCLVSTSIRTRE